MVSKIRRLRHDLEVRLRSVFKMKKRGFLFKPRHYSGPFLAGYWGEIEEALSYHSDVVAPLDTLHRLVKEQCRILGCNCPERIDQKTATVACESWPTERLMRLPRMHDRDLPRDEEYPILVYQTDEFSVIVDGHTRVNKWTQKGGNRIHRVLVIRPRDGIGAHFSDDKFDAFRVRN